MTNTSIVIKNLSNISSKHSPLHQTSTQRRHRFTKHKYARHCAQEVLSFKQRQVRTCEDKSTLLSKTQVCAGTELRSDDP